MLDPLGDRARHPSIIRMSSEKKKVPWGKMLRKTRHLIQKCDMIKLHAAGFEPATHLHQTDQASVQGLLALWMH
jgi:hypothetical protein